jgi:hypothetical protein
MAHFRGRLAAFIGFAAGAFTCLSSRFFLEKKIDKTH